MIRSVGDQRRTAVRAPKRRRRRRGERRRQAVEPADRHPGGLDPDPSRATLPQDLGERLVVARRWHDDRVRGRASSGVDVHEASGNGLIAEIDHEHAPGGREDDESGSPDKSGEVADIGQVRHDERVDGGGAHALPCAFETRDDRGNATVHLLAAETRAGHRPRQRTAWIGTSRRARAIAARNASSSTRAGGSGATATCSRLYRNAHRSGSRWRGDRRRRGEVRRVVGGIVLVDVSGISPRRRWMSARARMAARFSGALRRTCSSSTDAASNSPISTRARPKRDAGGNIRGVPQQARSTGLDRFGEQAEAPVLLGQRGEGNRRRVPLDPALQFLDSGRVGHDGHQRIYGSDRHGTGLVCRSTRVVGDGERHRVGAGGSHRSC